MCHASGPSGFQSTKQNESCLFSILIEANCLEWDIAEEKHVHREARFLKARRVDIKNISGVFGL